MEELNIVVIEKNPRRHGLASAFKKLLESENIKVQILQKASLISGDDLRSELTPRAARRQQNKIDGWYRKFDKQPKNRNLKRD